MRILLLSQFFWPEERTAPTNLAALAADLVAQGHELLVITGVPNHPFGKVYAGYQLKLWQWDTYHNVPILRLPLYPNHGTSLRGRLANYISFALSAIVIGTIAAVRFRPEILFVYYAPLTMGWPAKVLQFFTKAKLVYWITDLWPENLRATNANISDQLYKLLRRFEDWGYRQADKICVDSPGYQSNLIAKGVDINKIQIVAEWADESLFFPVAPDRALAKKFDLEEKFNIIYGGNLGTVQGLSTVIDAAKLLQDFPDIQFVFIGDGNDLEALQKQAKSANLKNIKFIPRQPMQEIHRFFALADVLLVHLKKEPIFELQLPSKVIAYLACSRPILCAVPGASAKVVMDAKAGLSCPSQDPTALAQMVRQFSNMTDEELKKIGDNGRQAYLQYYTRSAQVNRLETIFQNLVSQVSDRTKMQYEH